MFEIKVADVDVTGGNIPVSWCLDVETIKALADDNVKDPQVIIVVSPEGDLYHIAKEYRKVVPLKDLMTYVEFRVPGKNKIWAFVSVKSNKEARDRYLGKDCGQYYTSILSHEGDSWGSLFDHVVNDTGDLTGEYRPKYASETLSVNVPNEAFATEPAIWEKNWVNHFFKNKCVDQCDFRRRRIFAWLVQPFIMLAQLVVRFILLVAALLIGARDISLQPLLHPLQYDIFDAFNICGGGSFFIRHLKEDDSSASLSDVLQSPKGLVSYMFRSLWLTPFMPLILIPLAINVYVNFKQFLIISGAVAGAIGVVVFMLLFGGFLFGGGLKKLISWAAAKAEKKEPELWYLDQQEINLLTCNPDKKALTFETLPKEKKTLMLRFSDLKSKVCRPFSA